MIIAHLPAFARVINKFAHVVPKDGVMRQSAVRKMWFAPGQTAVAQHLWQTVRWLWRDKSGLLTIFYDPRGPLTAVYRLPFWMPKTEFTFALAAPETMNDGRLLYY
jgi:hypothetical protein